MRYDFVTRWKRSVDDKSRTFRPTLQAHMAGPGRLISIEPSDMIGVKHFSLFAHLYRTFDHVDEGCEVRGKLECPGCVRFETNVAHDKRRIVLDRRSDTCKRP